MTDAGRDRLRELLDAVLDDGHGDLDAMAAGAATSPFHFSRLLRRDAGEAPVGMRRRVMLERAAWQIAGGTSVTDAAWAAGYESVDGFRRAFGRAYGHPPADVAPGRTPTSHWLPAPNGIHFHPPTSLWVTTGEHAVNPLTEMLVHHDLDDTRALITRVRALSEEDLHRHVLPGHQVLSWDLEEPSIIAVLANLVWTKQVWLAAIEGEDQPAPPTPDLDAIEATLDTVGPRWVALVRDIDRRGAWDDRIVDALCDPPESFVLGSIVAHVLTYAAHRRQLVRQMLRAAGHEADHGDPIEWLRTREGETP